ncbi:hypothetical protein FHU38_002476 [Saccharomonospora amisosensis]|uniref:Uncharacterized protein n=1 Tax=Saccharomonospora amisosensis TaxID=1128677 RepID=A0A7X5ZQU0_9PSEU|nr:hypothetical protein [Saccharomonospora amisosensis]NIJ12132.1 hypothetical protein [Saccharomonospora amisosensis]
MTSQQPRPQEDCPTARLAERTRREVAQAWQGEEESAVAELIDGRRAEAQREAAE